MRNMKRLLTLMSVSVMTLTMISGCNQPNRTAPATNQQTASDIVRVMGQTYNPDTKTVTLETAHTKSGAQGENIVDTASETGVANYVTSVFPNSKVQWVKLSNRYTSKMLPISSYSRILHSTPPSQTSQAGSFAMGASVGSLGTSALPPGVRFDPNVQPVANRHVSRDAKAASVIQIARSKLGTPYIWGHNEDRGQYGFDCSNFVSYVYHHALGYIFSGSSQVQNASVGWRVSTANPAIGDLLIFENGKHVGIYAGNGKMIEEGGGLGKVGYLAITPGTYWHNHLTSVRRMF
jgi:cell wall-associated NlpC family hydrolase